jgi:hypothetical protein
MCCGTYQVGVKLGCVEEKVIVEFLPLDDISQSSEVLEPILVELTC